jgi:1-aminocyclopropane-1-carboxylate deaminase/D-cysteine desulfhydrase-like pyridoxal-dependent ACC family enzyme
VKLSRRKMLIGSSAAVAGVAAGGLTVLHRSHPDWSMPGGWQARLPNGIGNRTRPLLFESFPKLAEAVPWISLGQFPTPVTRLEAVERELELECELWLKREDQSSPLYGGNKVRKMEFVLADALGRGCDALIGVGGIGSHQCCASARLAKEFGLAHGAAMFPQPVTAHVHQNLRYNLWCNTEFFYSPGYASTVLKIRSTYEKWRSDGRRPYFIYLGASTPLGILGFVDMMLELREQIDAGVVSRPDRIDTAAGSSGTLAGLLLGQKLAGLDDVEIVGVAVADRATANRLALDYLSDAALANLRSIEPRIPASTEPPWSSMRFDRSHFGGSYGVPTREGLHAKEMLLQLEDVTLEATYTAKTMAAMLADARREPGKKLMMLHTYNGAPYPDDMPGLEHLPEEMQWIRTAPFAAPVEV